MHIILILLHFTNEFLIDFLIITTLLDKNKKTFDKIN